MPYWWDRVVLRSMGARWEQPRKQGLPPRVLHISNLWQFIPIRDYTNAEGMLATRYFLHKYAFLFNSTLGRETLQLVDRFWGHVGHLLF